MGDGEYAYYIAGVGARAYIIRLIPPAGSGISEVRKMARGRKTSEEKREKAKALIYLNPDVSEPELARTVGIGKSTAHYLKKDIIENDIGKDKFESLRDEKKRQFIEEAWEVVGKALRLTNKRFTKALEDEDALEEIIEKINSDGDLKGTEKQALYRRLKDLQMSNIKDIAITLGTIYDKQALASGEPTTITERKEPTPDLVKELEQKVQKLKEMTG